MPKVPEERPMRQSDRTYELSIDTGGTFTDGFVSSPARSAQVKVDTTQYDLTVSFGECVSAAAAAMGKSVAGFLGRTALVQFSSTIATNLMVQRSGAKVGLIVTSYNGNSFYGSSQNAEALRTFLVNGDVKGITGCADETGRIVAAVDENELEEAVRELLGVGVERRRTLIP